MLPSEVVNAYGVSQHVVQPSSLDLSLVTTIGITGRERRTTCTQLDQQGKAWATNAQQDWHVNVIINNQLLNMQSIKVWRANDTATSSWSLLSLF
jgi:hypothetical protein